MKLLTSHRLLLSTILPATALGTACAPTAATTGVGAPPPSRAVGAAANPFFVESTLPYHAPRFDVIRNEDYQPALEEGMRQQIAEIDAIARQTVPPTFDNTIVAM